METAIVRKELQQEIDALPDARLLEVLDFVRFLRMRTATDSEVAQAFDEALTVARDTARKERITEADIQAEIRAARAQR